MLHDRILVALRKEDGDRRSTGGILIPATAQVAKRLVGGEAGGVGSGGGPGEGGGPGRRLERAPGEGRRPGALPPRGPARGRGARRGPDHPARARRARRRRRTDRGVDRPLPLTRGPWCRRDEPVRPRGLRSVPGTAHWVTMSSGCWTTWSDRRSLAHPGQPGLRAGERGIADLLLHRLAAVGIGPPVGAEEAQIGGAPVQRRQRVAHPGVSDVPLAV